MWLIFAPFLHVLLFILSTTVIKNNLITPNQSGLKTDDLCINQLIFITHEIYKWFDDGYKVKSVFHYISKAFGKVWCQGIHAKMRQNEMSGELLNTLTDFLDKKKTQREGQIKRSIFLMG